MRSRSLKVAVFSSLEEENRAEYAQRATQSVSERFKEFAIIQERVFGKRWTEEPIKKVAQAEILTW